MGDCSMKKTTRCEQCHQSFWYKTGGRSIQEQPAPWGIPEGQYNARFCSKACAKEWEATHPGQSSLDGSQKAALGCLMFALKIPKLLFKAAKAVFRGLWKVAKFFLRLVFNKYVLTIFTAGISYFVWKGLNAVYAKKEVAETKEG